MVDDNIALTSGHCIYDATGNLSDWCTKKHGLAKEIRVFPGRIDDQYPYYAGAAHCIVDTGWTSNLNSEYDWGIIVLDSNVGEKCGTFGFAYSESYAGWPGQTVTVAGYPGEYPIGTPVYTQYAHKEKVNAAHDRYMTYLADTSAGQSGAPVLEQGTNYAVSIHHGQFQNKHYNMGVNINKSRFQTILKYMNQY